MTSTSSREQNSEALKKKDGLKDANMVRVPHISPIVNTQFICESAICGVSSLDRRFFRNTRAMCCLAHINDFLYEKQCALHFHVAQRGPESSELVRRICWQLCLQHNEAWLPSLNWGWPWTPTIDVRDFTTCRCGLAVLYKPLQLSKTLRALAQEVNIFSGCSVTHT